MLVLTRKVAETIQLTTSNAQTILIEVLSLTNGTTRIGVQAPDDVKILRGELVGTEPKRKKRA